VEKGRIQGEEIGQFSKVSLRLNKIGRQGRKGGLCKEIESPKYKCQKKSR